MKLYIVILILVVVFLLFNHLYSCEENYTQEFMTVNDIREIKENFVKDAMNSIVTRANACSQTGENPQTLRLGCIDINRLTLPLIAEIVKSVSIFFDKFTMQIGKSYADIQFKYTPVTDTKITEIYNFESLNLPKSGHLDLIKNLIQNTFHLQTLKNRLATLQAEASMTTGSIGDSSDLVKRALAEDVSIAKFFDELRKTLNESNANEVLIRRQKNIILNQPNQPNQPNVIQNKEYVFRCRYEPV
jgi:hypothetical protein